MRAPPSGGRQRRARAIAGRTDRTWWLALASAAAFLFIDAPAKAQVAGSISIDSDYRLRGYSLSGRRPVATLDLSYDHDSGVYVNAAATTVLTDKDHVDLLAVEGSIGYARRITKGLSVDGGVSRSQYPVGFARYRRAHYTEIYLGLTSDRISSHIYYSPDYLRPGVSTLYGEIDALFFRIEKVNFSGHIGLLETIALPAGSRPRELQHDWRIGASRQFGPFELHAALTGGGPGADYYDGAPHSRTAVTAGASWFF